MDIRYHQLQESFCSSAALVLSQAGPLDVYNAGQPAQTLSLLRRDSNCNQPAALLLKSQLDLLSPVARFLYTGPKQLFYSAFPPSQASLWTQEGIPNTSLFPSLEEADCGLCLGVGTKRAPALQLLPFWGLFGFGASCGCRFCSHSERRVFFQRWHDVGLCVYLCNLSYVA